MANDAATVNGKPLLDALVTEPRIGVWTAEFNVDSDESLSGKVTLEIDGVTWLGTVTRAEAVSGRCHAHVIGGAGKLATKLDAKYYTGAALGAVLTDIMSATGETLSATTASAVRSRVAGRWMRAYGTAGAAIRAVADDAAVSWRVLRDGSVWLGTDTWDEADADFDETLRIPSQGSVTVAPVMPTIAPGTTLQGRRISRVMTRFNAGVVRQELLFEDERDNGYGRVGDDLVAIVEAIVGARIDYARMYPAKVVKQATDGSLELMPDDPRMRGTGVTKVPIRHGLPGVHVKVNPGAYVLLFFENGDQKLPAAALWPDGSSTKEITIKSDKLTVQGDLYVTGEVYAKSASPAETVKLSSHKHPTAMGPSDKPLPNS